MIAKNYDILKRNYRGRRTSRKGQRSQRKIRIQEKSRGAMSEVVHRLRRAELTMKRSMKTSPDCEALETV